MENTTPELRERGTGPDGKPIYSSRRLYMQLQVYGGCQDAGALSAALKESDFVGVLYEDLNDPLGVAILSAHEDPNYFVTTLRDLLSKAPFRDLEQKLDMTMFGRTYTLGYETDLDHVLVNRPMSRIVNTDWPWAVWYPLRRSGAFEQLDPKEQREALMEHGRLGSAYGEAGHAHDIRLACHGLDKQDNDFVIGLLGTELQPLSAIVQAMRKTKQTSQYIEKLGPFFIGRALWKSQE